MTETTKYNYLENVLQGINKSFISLAEDDVNLYNRVLRAVLEEIIKKMKDDNLLFKSLYQNVFYGGSYFDGLKIGKPEEFDLDLLLVIPKYTKPVITSSNMAGYVHVKLQEFEKFIKQPEASRYPVAIFSQNSDKASMCYTGLKPKRRRPQNKYKVKVRTRKMQELWNYIRYSKDLNCLTELQRIILSNLVNLLNDQFFLNTTKVSAWIEGIITKALNKFPKSQSGESIIETSQGALRAKMHKGGPAHTLKLKGRINNKDVGMDVDLVPCFVFTKDHWPGKPYRTNVVKNKNEFFIVPKKPSNTTNVEKYWRLSLQEQERVLINGYQNLKPTIKLLKKLRDSLDHKMIASYYIKTIFLWELEKNKTLWNSPLSYVFMTMLERYQECLEKKKILYYWNSQNNLINFSEVALQDMANRLKRMINDIKRNPQDEYVVAKYLLTSRELTDFKTSNQFRKLEIINGAAR